MTNNKRRLIIGARGSKLSLWQANYIADRLVEAHPGLTVEIKTFVTSGDRFLDAPLAKLGGKGLFTKEIETAILSGEVDLAVHSLKDMPADLPPGLVLAAVTQRFDPDDALVSNKYKTLAALPVGAKVGTSSLRRRAQLLAFRPDLQIENLRGNVDTRLKKLDSGMYDAIVLAAVGLRRLRLADRIAQVLPREVCLPAVGQGVLAIETRADDAVVKGLVACLEDPFTRLAITAERAYLRQIGGSCQVPIAAFAQVNDGSLHLQAVILSVDGSEQISESVCGSAADAAELGRQLALRMLAAGGDRILAALEQSREAKT